MSAFLVNRETIDVLVRAAITYAAPSRLSWFWGGRRREVADDPATFGQLLWDWNLRSVLARYPDTSPETWGAEPYTEPRATGPLDIYAGLVPTHGRPDPVVVLKCCECLEYQSCEHPGWDKDEAYAALQAVKDAAINALPGYGDAPWGMPERQAVAVVSGLTPAERSTNSPGIRREIAERRSGDDPGLCEACGRPYGVDLLPSPEMIAAAPELYEALRRFVATEGSPDRSGVCSYCSGPADHAGYTSCPLNIARAALAKAEGVER